MARNSPPLTLSKLEVARLVGILGDPLAAPELVKRARFIHLVNSGLTNLASGEEVAINKGTASRWRHAVIKYGLEPFLRDGEALGEMRRKGQARRLLPKRGRGRPRKYPRPGEPLSEVPITGNMTDLDQPEKWSLAGIYLSPPNYGLVLARVVPMPRLSAADEQALREDAFVSEEVPEPVVPARIPVRAPVRLASAIFYNQARLQRLVTPHYDPAGWLAFLQAVDEAWPQATGFDVIIENGSSYTYQNPDLQAWLAQHGGFHIVDALGGADWVRMAEERLLKLAEVMGAEGAAECLVAAEALETAAARKLSAPEPIQWLGAERARGEGRPAGKIPSFEVVRKSGRTERGLNGSFTSAVVA